MSPEELRDVGRRVVEARKRINIREGWTRDEDTLPASLLAETEDSAGSTVLSRERLETMIAAYYRERGWDDCGIPRHPAEMQID